ncbi:MAG: hypothetical protein Kow0037_17240 [Calditrichia bacterium]
MIQIYQYENTAKIKGLYLSSVWEEESTSGRRGKKGSSLLLMTAPEVAGPCAEAEQVHGGVIKEVSAPGLYRGCDGLITNRPGLPLVIRTADCAAVVLFHPRKKWLANLHAGWRGARAGIHQNGLKKLLERSGGSAAEVFAWVSPCIHPCCYRVGGEFMDYFDAKYLPEKHGRLYFDLPQNLLDGLREMGLPPGNIAVAGECTHCGEMNFPSYRRNKTANRLYTVAKIEEE